MEQPPKSAKYDKDSVANFMSGLADDHTKMRFKVLEMLSKTGTPQAELDSMLAEIEGDAVMIKQEEEKARSYAATTEAHAATMESQAMIDELTGLPNVRAFDVGLHSEISRLNRLEREHHVHENVHVLFIDLDHFKSINDNIGHDIGDLYLKIAAQAMHGELRRESDVLARKGGDEFAAMLFGNDDASAHDLAEKIRQAVLHASVVARGKVVKRGKNISDVEGNISASIGVASFRKGEKPEELLKRADKAMYEAKEGGRDQVVVAE